MQSYCGTDYIGLSINASVLRAVVVSGKKKAVSALVQQPVEGFILDGGNILKADLFKLALKKLSENCKKLPSCISVSLPEKYALTKELSFPKLSNKEIEEAVFWKARNIFPLPVEEMYIDWKVVKETSSGFEIFVVALPKIIVDELVRILQELGFRPVNIQTSASAMARLLPPDGDKQHIIINAGRDGIEATLVEGSLEKITATSEIIEEKKFNKAVISTTRKLIDFYQTKTKNGLKLEDIWTSGEFASETLNKKLKEEFSVRTNFLNMPVRTKNKQMLLAFSEAIAIALAPIQPPSSEKTINLLPRKIQKYYDSAILLKKVKKLSSIFLALLAAVFLIELSGFGYIYYKSKNLKMNALSSKTLSENKTNSSVSGQIQDELKSIKKKTEQIIYFSGNNKTPKGLIAQFFQYTNSGLTIQSWHYNKKSKQLIIEGKTETRDKLLEFKKDIEKIKEVESVDIPLSSLAKKINYNFKIVANLRSN